MSRQVDRFAGQHGRQVDIFLSTRSHVPVDLPTCLPADLSTLPTCLPADPADLSTCRPYPFNDCQFIKMDIYEKASGIFKGFTLYTIRMVLVIEERYWEGIQKSKYSHSLTKT